MKVLRPRTIHVMRPGREEPGGGGRLLVRERSAREFAAERSILRVGNGKWKREAFRRYHFITWCILAGPQILTSRCFIELCVCVCVCVQVQVHAYYNSP